MNNILHFQQFLNENKTNYFKDCKNIEQTIINAKHDILIAKKENNKKLINKINNDLKSHLASIKPLFNTNDRFNDDFIK